jgi:hypothetical protein
MERFIDRLNKLIGMVSAVHPANRHSIGHTKDTLRVESDLKRKSGVAINRSNAEYLLKGFDNGKKKEKTSQKKMG